MSGRLTQPTPCSIINCINYVVNVLNIRWDKHFIHIILQLQHLSSSQHMKEALQQLGAELQALLWHLGVKGLSAHHHMPFIVRVWYHQGEYNMRSNQARTCTLCRSPKHLIQTRTVNLIQVLQESVQLHHNQGQKKQLLPFKGIPYLCN